MTNKWKGQFRCFFPKKPSETTLQVRKGMKIAFNGTNIVEAITRDTNLTLVKK